MSQHRSVGFTIIELLVVVAMIGILTSIVLPVFMNMQRNTRYNTCMENLRQTGISLALYHDDFGSYPAAPSPDFLAMMSTAPLPPNDQSVLQTAGAMVPLSDGLQWTIIDKASATALRVTSVDELAQGMQLTLTDTDTGNTQTVTVSALDDATGTLTIEETLTEAFANGGVASLVPADITAQPTPMTLQVSTIAGFAPGMRLALTRKGGDDGDAPMVTNVDATAKELTVSWPLASGYVGGTATRAIDNFGLATMYYLYLTDKRNYLQTIQRFHCPEVRRTEKVDRGLLLTNTPGGGDGARQFDPSWSGYNTYDLTYNYDQYDGAIADFDATVGYGAMDTKRQLRFNTPPADTVVCWCYGHGNNKSAAYWAETPVTIDPTNPNAKSVREYEVERAKDVRLVLWADGSVLPVRPVLMKAKSANTYVWVPPFLYTPGDAHR